MHGSQGFQLSQASPVLPQDTTDADLARTTLMGKLGLSATEAQGMSLHQLAEMLVTKLTNVECRLAWMSPGNSPHDC